MTPLIINDIIGFSMLTNHLFDQARQSFLDDLRLNHRASATILAYQKDIQQLIDFLTDQKKTSLNEASLNDLQLFLKNLTNNGFTSKTICRKLNALKAFYRFLIEKEVIKENIASLLPYPKTESKTIRILSRLEYRALRDACRQDPRSSALIELLLQTGLRISELTLLTLKDIKEKTLYIKAYESHPEREIPLNNSAKNALDNYLKNRSHPLSDHLFITKTGRPLLVRNIRNIVNRYFKEAGITNACVNDLRHTFIYHQLAAGVLLSFVSKLIGHKRLTSTKRYLELVKNKVKDRTRLKEL